MNGLVSGSMLADGRTYTDHAVGDAGYRCLRELVPFVNMLHIHTYILETTYNILSTKKRMLLCTLQEFSLISIVNIKIFYESILDYM